MGLFSTKSTNKTNTDNSNYNNDYSNSTNKSYGGDVSNGDFYGGYYDTRVFNYGSLDNFSNDFGGFSFAIDENFTNSNTSEKEYLQSDTYETSSKADGGFNLDAAASVGVSTGAGSASGGAVEKTGGLGAYSENGNATSTINPKQFEDNQINEKYLMYGIGAIIVIGAISMFKR